MPTLRTTLSLRKYDARRLMARGYEILHIETRHRDEDDETETVWIRPPRPDDVPEHELPHRYSKGLDPAGSTPFRMHSPGLVHCFRARLFGAAFSTALSVIDERNQILIE